MKIRRKKLTLSYAAVEKDKVENNAAIENIQPVCPDSKEKKTGAAVADFKLNACNDQFGGNLPAGSITALQKLQLSGILNTYQLILTISIATPKMVA